MIDHAVIIAAGLGSRLRASAEEPPKPLQKVAGRTLIERTVSALARGGIRAVTVVVGYRADEIRAAVDKDPALQRADLTIRFVDNPEYEKSNGLSVLAARAVVDTPFLLSMSDHIYAPPLVELARTADMNAADLYLCVDRRIDQIYDIDDATKVQTRAGFIEKIGKTLPAYDAIDCGVFAIAPALFDLLATVAAERGDCSLSDGVQALAERQRARVLDIGDNFWQDVDTPEARRHAEAAIDRLGLDRDAGA